MLVEKFKEHYGTTEYNGIVADIQKWFYGSLVRASWCATSTSFFMNKLGLLNIIGGKNENVYLMMNACKKYADEHPDQVTFFDKDNIPTELRKDDILFWLWSGEMKVTGNKHVGVCERNTDSDSIACIGGNQRDMICTMNYDRRYLYAVYRWTNTDKYEVGWHQDEVGGWWYADTPNTYLQNCWKVINHHWYYFGDDGYILTGANLINGEWYFLTPHGNLEGACKKTDENGALIEWYVD